jgi:hypothetical protein
MQMKLFLIGMFVLTHPLYLSEAVVEDIETVEVIDYSELVVFDAFNGSYLSRQDYRGLLLPADQEPGTVHCFKRRTLLLNALKKFPA